MSGPTGGDVCALLLGANGKVGVEKDFVFYNQPRTSGAALSESDVLLDLAALPDRTERIICAISIEAHQPALGSGTPPHGSVADGTDDPRFEFTASGLTTERAVVMFEIYRRQGFWKLRAVGQGFDGGLGALATAHGIEIDGSDLITPPTRLSDGQTTDAPVSQGTSQFLPPGTSDAERQLQVLTSIFEDAARSAAGYRSAIAFAEQRRERERSVFFEDPRLREMASPGWSDADERHADLVIRATSDHRRDVDVLAQELRELGPKLPAALSPWAAPVWRSGRFGRSAGVRVGELSLPEAPDLQIPLALGLPLRRPVWLRNGPSEATSLAAKGFSADGSAGGVGMALALIIRLLAADESLRLHLCDPGAVLTGALGVLATPTGGVLGAPLSVTAEQRSQALRMMAERVDLLEMARSAGAEDALAQVHNPALLVLTDVPIDFEAEDHHLLRYLAEHAGGSAVQIVLLGDPEPGPSLELARRSLLLEPDGSGGISDGWVGLPWTFAADYGPADPASIVFRAQP